MYAISQIGGLVLLAIVLYEVQNAVRAVIFAIDWPAEIRIIQTREGLKPTKGAPLTRKERRTIALYRFAQDSLFLHEIHSLRMRESVAFRVLPSILFGAVVMATAVVLVGLAPNIAAKLGLCAWAALFASSQARSFAKFHANRAAYSKELQAVFNSFQP